MRMNVIILYLFIVGNGMTIGVAMSPKPLKDNRLFFIR